MSSSPLTTIIIDDHNLFRAGLKKLLEDRGEVRVVAEFESEQGVEEYLTANVVNLVILDISLPGINGLELIKSIKKTTKAKILVLSMHRVAEYCRLALKRGADGYVLKEDAFEDLSKAITAACELNKQYISPSITKAAADQFFSTRVDLLPDLLTKTEKIILGKIAEGLSNREIGMIMKISVRTVETHRAHILKKLKIKNTAGLVQYAVKQQMIQL